MNAKVVKSSSTSGLETRINDVLKEIGGNFVDLKLSGANDGKDEVFVAVILYK